MVKIESYQLHIHNVNQIVWTRKKLPSLYVKARLEPEQWIQRTGVVKRNLTPVWDKKILLFGKPSSMLHFSVKHDNSNPLIKNPFVGEVEIELSTLLRKCENNKRASLELKSVQHMGHATTTGVITIQLNAVDDALAGAIATSNARQDIDRRNIVQAAGVLLSTPRETINAAYNVGPKPSTFLQPLQSVISKLDIFVRIIDNTSKVHPYASFAWQVLSSLYKAVQGQLDRDQKLVALLETMENVYSFVDTIQSLPNKLQLLEDVIPQILKQTVECSIFIREYVGHGFAGRAAIQAFTDPSQTIQALTNNLKELKRHFDSGITLQVAFVSSKTLEKVEKLVEIENLKRLNPARMDAVARPECLPETRQDILKWVTDWLTTPSTKSNTLWLYGLAGSGKSTVSTTIAEYFRALNRLAAFMFFDRNDPTNSQPTVVTRTLAYKLGSFSPSIQAAVCESIARDPGVTEALMRVQFTKLLLEPLGSLSHLHAQGPVVVILDALDESGDQVSRKELLALLAQNLSRFPRCFRFLITSRREADIEDSFSCCDNIVARELPITDQSNDPDIYSYIHHHMADLRKKPSLQLSPSWPGEETMQALTASSGGLFVWASTAVKFVADAHYPDQRLRMLLQPHPREAESALDALYGTALGASGKWDEPDAAADFRAVLGLIVVGRVPLSDATIDDILGFDGYRSSRHILTRLRCLFHWTPGEVVRALHASLPDYLADARRCKGLPWSIDVSSHHRNLVLACFRIMKDGLRFNICGLESSHLPNEDVPDFSTRVSNHIPPTLSYACRFWADHLKETGFEPSLLAGLDEFFRVQFLYWLEVLSLIQEVDIASPALVTAAKWTKAHDGSVAAFATDANSFVSTFQSAISRSAPHIYISALPLSPIKSLVSKQYLPHIPQRLSVDIGRMMDWPVSAKVLEGHTNHVWSVAFSPDGKQIASGSADNSVRVWDAETGRVASGPFEGHTDIIFAVAFSPDGKQIASGSADMTVRMWDAETGIQSRLFSGHTGAVRSVAISPDGKHIVSGSGDKTVQVWDIKTGKLVSGPFKNHTNFVYSVAFSPDGKQIASGSSDRTLRVWDAETGVSSGPFKGHTSLVYCVAFSPNGKHIASGSDDDTIRVWDAETGQLASGPFQGHTGAVWALAFSPDGQHIVSGSSDNTIRIWNVETAKMVSGLLEGHTGAVRSVALSHDGKQIVSGSVDQTVRLWDTARTVTPAPFEGHTSRVLSVALSPDGKQTASGSSDRTVRVWDAETGHVVSGPFEGHTGAVQSVAFSPDGKQITSGSKDGTIRVWNAVTGLVAPTPFKGHTREVLAVAFSPDGKHIVSGSRDKTVQMWDTDTGHQASRPFRGHKRTVSCVAFSPDGKHIVSGSFDKTVRVWNAETGVGQVASRSFDGHRDNLWAVAFSPDGKHIVSGSDDVTVRMWDALTGTVSTAHFKGHTNAVFSVSLSPDGKHIVSGSRDQIVRVWDINTGKVVLLLEGHTDAVRSVIFSADGKKIISGSYDQTIRVWAVETGVLSTRPADSFPMYSQDSTDHVRDFPRLVNGWMVGMGSELLFWVPPYHRAGLWGPRNTAVMGRRVTKLNFSQFVHGTSWTQIQGP